MADDLEYRIAKLKLESGDILILKFDVVLTKEQAARIREDVKHIAPGTKALILDHHAELSVLTRAEIEARTA